MDQLKQSRAAQRGLFTKTYKKLDVLLSKEESTVDELVMQLQLLQDRAKQLRLCDDRVLEALQETKVDQDTYDQEFSEIEDYHEKFTLIRMAVAQVQRKQQSSVPETDPTPPPAGVSVAAGPAARMDRRLPEFEIVKFDGDPRHWITFWNQFKRIHTDTTLEAEYKLQLLLHSTKPGSKPREIVSSFPASAENYEPAVNYLKERFGNESVLIQVYIRDLLQLIIVNKTATIDLCTLYDSLQTQLRALESLGVTQHNYAHFLYPLVESALPIEILKAWERDRGKNLHRGKSDLDQLINFLKNEVDSEIRVKLARESFNSGARANNNISNFKNKGKESYRKQQIPVAHELLSNSKTFKSSWSDSNNSKNKKSDCCLFCESKAHTSETCCEISSLSLAERKDIVRQKNACFTCLRQGHRSRSCFSKHKCVICGRRHFCILCPELPIKEQVVENLTAVEVEKTITSLNKENQFSEVLLQTLVLRLHNDGKEMLIRAIYDSGAQKSYLKDDVIKTMNLKPLSKITLKQSLFGGHEITERVYNSYHIEISNLNGSYKCKIAVLNHPQICSKIDRISSSRIAQDCNRYDIPFSDFAFQTDCDPEIKLLIGADFLCELLIGHNIKLPSGPLAVQTKLGWVVFGRHCFDYNLDSSVGKGSNCGGVEKCNVSAHAITSLLIKDVDALYRIENLNIHDPINSNADDLAIEIEKHFLDSIRLDNDGRYQIQLPWVLQRERLPTNKLVAEKNALSVKRKLIASDKLKDYTMVFDEWLTLDFIERVNEDKKEECHYLPHRPIFKENATTKIRPVFNAASHTLNTLSLNDCLATGPNLISQIPSILTRFRKFKTAVSGDICKAFCQISIHEKDTDYLRFLWWENDNFDKLVTYRHKRVVFGLTCSPYLLAATLRYHLERVSENLRGTAEILKSSFYVDNALASFPTQSEMVTFITESRIIMSAAHFDLRGWQANISLPIIDPCNETEISILGLIWDKNEDTLSCKLEPVQKIDVITKRVVLSKVNLVFDVIGYTVPALLLPKLVLQKTWELKLKWDDPIPDDLAKQFKKWFAQLPLLANIKVPRWLYIEPLNPLISCHLFCDASQLAYACCIYIRVEINETVKVNLLSARSKIRPLSKATIPRLELLACSIGARLLFTTLNDLQLPEIDIHCYSDSQTALSWIKRNQNWGIFVQNRVKEIRSLTSPNTWRHIAGVANPADLASRGCTVKQLIERRWWQGPEWLYLSEENWPKSNEIPDEEIVNSEMRKTVIVNLNRSVDELNWYYRYFSSYKKIVRMIAWILRFLDKTRKVNTDFVNDLSLNEIQRGEKCLFKLIQQDSFAGCSDPKLKNLKPMIDDEGILRAKTNLLFRDDTRDFKYPMILPSKHPVVKLLIMSAHQDLLHAGTSMLMSSLREQFWILKARKTIRDCLRKCVKCQRFTGKHFEAQPGILPADRVRDASVFEILGVDVAGPLHLRGGQKAYIVLYTCAVYRAIHLELVTLLSTEAFLQSLRRFIARRGRPKIIYSDNGTNFVGADRALSAIDWNRVRSNAVEQKIQWKFNPPSAAWWGGWWERLIQMIKQILRKILGRASLTYEELLTVLCDCEQVVNTRPLTYVSEDIDCLTPITPSMFLHEITVSGVPDIDEIDHAKLNKRAKHLQKLRDVLRSRFRSEYLGQLCQKSLKDQIKNPISEGDIVLLEDPNKKRTFWNLARVLKLIPGKDGHKRLALIKTETTELLRPVQRLYRLELDIPINDNNEQLVNGEILKTRSGRVSKPPNRL